MRYTLWKNGQKVAETRFELRPGPNRLGGVLHATSVGAAVFRYSGPEGKRVSASTNPGEEFELRDPSGRALVWESILITDVSELSARAARGRCCAFGRLASLPGDPIRFMISATLAADADPPPTNRPVPLEELETY